MNSDAQRRQEDAAAKRFDERSAERSNVISSLQKPGGLAAVNVPERLAMRLDRLSRYYAGEPVPVTSAQVPETPPAKLIESALDRASASAASDQVGTERSAGMATAGVKAVASAAETVADDVAPSERAGIVLERVINSADFLDVRFLEAGVAAARAVCRIAIQGPAGPIGFGTGSLVSPSLLLTNHHVLESAEVARRSRAEFDFQDGLDGAPLPVVSLGLDPDAFFIANEERDFALVAVGATAQAVSQFGMNPLIEAEGKAVIGEFVTIVQHPRGNKKQVALRENRIVDLLDTFLHYEADTEPGSSGSPVFNDQWEIVALHHASVPAPTHDELGGFMNEGIRASRILKFVRAQTLPASAQVLADGLFAPERISVAATPPREASTDAPRLVAGLQALAADSSVDRSATEAGLARLSVPLEITVRLGTPEPARSPLTASDDILANEEAISIDPDYTNRRGYDSGFLGAGMAVPLPGLSAALLAKAATNTQSQAGDNHLFHYNHFSVAMSKERRLAFFTAVNIDGRTSTRLKRERDRWSLDPRLPGAEQIGEEVYRDNKLDRGHLVRRLDPAWGSSRSIAKRANDDTFHFTNCTPQHEDFNQNKTTWAGLEDYILDNADNQNFRACIFTGPVLAEDDDLYRSVKLPRQFWKVAVMRKTDGQLSATGYLLSQERLLAGLETEEEFSYGAYRTFQVPLARIESLTGLSFGPLDDSDPLAGLESDATAREINHPDDLRV